MNLTDGFQLVLVGAGTGFGTTFGVKMAEFVIDTLRARKQRKEANQG